MGFKCNEICTRYKAKKPVDGRRYANGQKRCSKCEIFIKWYGLWCPCCGFRLRVNRRGHKRRKYPKPMQMKQVITV